MDESKVLPAKGMMDPMEYVCPMHPEELSNLPGLCPICGMALILKSNSKMNETKFTCPMHPEVVLDHSGNCPNCGMTLIPINS